jgi:kanosamine 6-kinase
METSSSAIYEAEFTWPRDGGLVADLRAFDVCCLDFLARCDESIEAVGVAFPATLDSQGRVVAWPNRPSWTGFSARSFLTSAFPGAVICCADDGNAAALAEARETGCGDLAFIGVGTGIGGGLVLRGQVYPSLTSGCEIGHLVVAPRGPRCVCGRRGCAQAIASGPATLRRAALLREGSVTPDELCEGWALGRSWAVAAVDETAAALAALVVSLGELLRLGLITIGGGFAVALDGLVPAVVAKAAQLNRPGHTHAPVRAAALGSRSSLYGALLVAREAT